ncbi:efflux RND transporter periplasmic adaptor subunit [[Limnothrix rosea] IAM M-220]|uniref:efflux RND transporter periplasmic adaptor subunit n=1 Tax=[Limnothrix rosea] IAM M-220 TaxID=454133 RepID=UPI000960D303|nr:efflux RND transporter periplasmic adaptor subunit [[Limnothrix rosea] IAM M-220]OKH16977.1 efflux transporter periplasmic adaptor subunit [[Limnothrix rosea] IAM M-220]
MLQFFKSFVGIGFVASLSVLTVGCGLEQEGVAQPFRPEQETEEQPPLVDVAIAAATNAEATETYTGTTLPLKTVTVRSRLEGQLLALNVDVGDGVEQGRLLGIIEPDLLQTEVNEAAAELAARQFEVREAESELAEITAQIAQNKAALKQATADAKRFQELATTGAIAAQQAELAATAQETASQILRSSQAQLATKKQAIAAAQKRVVAQQAILAQNQERFTRTQIFSPQTGVIFSKTAEAGDTIPSGQTLVEIGDLSAVKVEIKISDRDLREFSLGKLVSVQLDAFPGETFSGEVTQISPIADPEARLIPVEVTIPNPAGKIAAGLLARVSKQSALTPTVTIPVEALEVGETSGDVIFVPVTIGEETTVQTRPVQLGEIDNGMVEILSGLNPNEKYILKGDRPLVTGETVTLSLLSEP